MRISFDEGREIFLEDEPGVDAETVFENFLDLLAEVGLIIERFRGLPPASWQPALS